MKQGFSLSPPRSEGVRRLKAAVDARCHTQAYQALCTHLKELETRIGQIKSITLGVNLDSNLHVTEAGLVSLNTSRFRAGNLMDRLGGWGKILWSVCPVLQTS